MSKKINISDFLVLQKFLKFDFLLASQDKKPMAGVTKFTDPETIVCETPAMLAAIKNPTEVEYPLVGIILKNLEGLSIGGKKLLVIDIDCKKDRSKGKPLFDKVISYLSSELGCPESTLLALSETTQSGGYHIFLSSNTLHPQRKIHIEEGVEIEIFSSGRYIATTPSVGYSSVSNSSYINFNDAMALDMTKTDIDYFVNSFGNAEQKVDDNSYDDKINENFIADNQNWARAVKGWQEFDKFMLGRNDSDWDSISKESTYDYVRFNILPIFAIFNKDAEFVEKIEQYGGLHVKKWASYPLRWRQKALEGTLIIGSDARKRLIKIGFFAKQKAKTRKDIIDDFVIDHMPHLFKHVILVSDGVYFYHEDHKHYVYLEKDAFNTTLCSYYVDHLTYNLAPEEYETLYRLFRINVKRLCLNNSFPNYKRYDLLADKSYQKVIPIVFSNGTLYIKKNEYLFKKSFFTPDDMSLLKVQCDYSEDMWEENDKSVVLDWFKTKFNPKDLTFIQLFFGQLLIPSFNPYTMLYVYSYEGRTGKSMLLDALKNIFNGESTRSITALPLTKLHERFNGSELATSLLNITTELDGRINPEEFKTVVSREQWRVENKNQDPIEIIPLAKHMAASNDAPRIFTDGGTTRRLAHFEMVNKKSRPDLNAWQHKREFFLDKKGLLGFMLNGIKMLQELNYIDLSTFYLDEHNDRIDLLKEYNSNVYEWLGSEGLEIITNASMDPNLKGLTVKEIYSYYKTWCLDNDYNVYKQRDMAKSLNTERHLVYGTPSVEGKRVRKIYRKGYLDGHRSKR